jgi:23S rRNA (cytosine1962-C5)-methyltransferase
MSQIKGPLKGEFNVIEISENEARMLVDVENGLKTGYFLDQRENRAAIKPYVKDARVLDAFCHTGGFSVHAGLYGAREIVSADISETALALAQKNFSLNGISCARTVCANVFDLLRKYQTERESFDTVILDPPAFVKNRAALEKGYAGYKEINLRAMKLIAPGGYLITFSCSQLMTLPLFLEMLKDAAADAGRDVRILELRMQSRDHPASIGQEQPLYLKCVAAQVL